MEFADIFKAYLEVGMLGLCAILMIIMFYQNYQKDKKLDETKTKKLNEQSDNMEQRFDKKDQINEDRYDKLLDIFQKQLQQNNEMLLTQINNLAGPHVLSHEENEHLIKVSDEIDQTLQKILEETNADRVSLVQYHNGGKGINKQSFLKMSMTNEQVKLGIKPFISNFKDQFRNVLAYFVKEINRSNYCYIDNVEAVKEVDISMYEFMKDRGVYAKFGIGVRNKENTIIGFICVEYLDNHECIDVTTIDNCLHKYLSVFETLLSL